MAYKGSTDQPARIDLFGIDNYISGLCSFITDCETPMTIAIQGDWGSGKTSVMEMVRDSINKDKKTVHCIWFNTWQFSQFNSGDNLSLALIESLVEGFNISDEAKKNMLSDVGRIGVSMLKKVAIGAVEVAAGGSAGNDLKNILDGNKSINESIKNLRANFQKCVSTAIEKNGVNRILVFIDDLDRLQPLRAVELLEVLKIFLDCEKCVFVLAIDYNVVVSGVKSKYGSDFDANKGRSFFDKIIQVPFKMPVAQYNIHDFVKRTFDDIANLKSKDSDIKNYVSLINSSIGSNPRSMKRLFNSYLLLLKVMDKGLDEKDVMGKKTLFAILCMQQHLEDFYNFVVLNRDEIDANFFNELAGAKEPHELLNNEGFDFQVKATKKVDSQKEIIEAEQIQAFVRCFNRVISGDSSETLDESNMEIIRGLLKTSSVTAKTGTEESSDKQPKARDTFYYNGDTYIAKGGKGRSLNYFALRLIKDYVAKTNKSADEFLEMISCIPAAWKGLKDLGIPQVCETSDNRLTKIAKNEYFFLDKDDIVVLDSKKLIVARGWYVKELKMLISLLGYDSVVTSNVH